MGAILDNSNNNSSKKLEAIIEVTTALCEIALKCDSCAVQFRQIIQNYRDNNNGNGNSRNSHQIGGSLSDLAGQAMRRNEGVSNVQTYSRHKYK